MEGLIIAGIVLGIMYTVMLFDGAIVAILCRQNDCNEEPE